MLSVSSCPLKTMRGKRNIFLSSLQALCILLSPSSVFPKYRRPALQPFELPINLHPIDCNQHRGITQNHILLASIGYDIGQDWRRLVGDRCLWCKAPVPGDRTPHQIRDIKNLGLICQ